MRVLITWGSERGGTEGIARLIGETLTDQGHDVRVVPARKLRAVEACDALVIGGAVYANRWHRDARRFVTRNVRALRNIPVWCFSSGPLDHSADDTDFPPCRDVAIAMQRIGACGHVTFGGRLAQDARGFPASAMAKERHGDYRNPDHIRSWALDLAEQLPSARPGIALDPPGGSLSRLLAHALTGWAPCAVVMALSSRFAEPRLANALQAIAATGIFVAIARHYFRARGAREPLPSALVFAAVVWMLDALIAGISARSLANVASLSQSWLPLGLIFAATWATGSIIAMLPEEEKVARAGHAKRVGDGAPPRAA